MRRRLPKIERSRQKSLEAAFDATKRFATKFENSPLKGTATIYNIGLYLLIADRDIQALKIDALTHPDEWTRKLCARIILLTIYEWDADKISGKTIKEAFDLLLVSRELQFEVYSCLRALRSIQNRATKSFSEIRNCAIAHRDPNALKQYRAIRDLDVEDVWALAADFFKQTEIFIRTLTKVLESIDPLQSTLRQWAASEKNNNLNR
jgi:hypothetical protein